MESIPELAEFVATHAWEGGFPDATIHDIKLAVTEALENIVRFACADRPAEITIRCDFTDAPALLVDIMDTGKQFNMLIMDVFPESSDFLDHGQVPSLKKLKKAIKNIEYRRDAKKNRNILALAIPR
jgi:anti-sigma regulatory factor (Ser/Thr protein kinase)